VDYDRKLRERQWLNVKDELLIQGKPYLHRSRVPLDQVQFDAGDRQAAFTYGMGNECQGMCGV